MMPQPVVFGSCPPTSSLGQISPRRQPPPRLPWEASELLWLLCSARLSAGLPGSDPTACSGLTTLCPQPRGSVRKTSSPARTATASGACGTAMVTMTVVTTAMSSVVSGAPGRQVGWLVDGMAMGGKSSRGSGTARTLNLPGAWRRAGGAEQPDAPGTTE